MDKRHDVIDPCTASPPLSTPSLSSSLCFSPLRSPSSPSSCPLLFSSPSLPLLLAFSLPPSVPDSVSSPCLSRLKLCLSKEYRHDHTATIGSVQLFWPTRCERAAVAVGAKTWARAPEPLATLARVGFTHTQQMASVAKPGANARPEICTVRGASITCATCNE